MANSSAVSARAPDDGSRRDRATAPSANAERGGRRAPPQQRGDAGAEQRDDHGVDQEQRQRRRQQDAPQVARFGIGVAGAPRAQRRGIERRDAVGRRQRVDRERAVGRAVETGRMIRRGAVAEVGGQRLRGRGRRAERAEAVERAQRRHGLGAWLRPRRRRPAWTCSRTISTIRRSISTKLPDIGRSDQRMSALT